MNLLAVLCVMTATVHLLALAAVAGCATRSREAVALALPLLLLAAGALAAALAHAAPDRETVSRWYRISQLFLVPAFLLFPAMMAVHSESLSRCLRIAVTTVALPVTLFAVLSGAYRLHRTYLRLPAGWVFLSGDARIEQVVAAAAVAAAPVLAAYVLARAATATASPCRRLAWRVLSLSAGGAAVLVVADQVLLPATSRYLSHWLAPVATLPFGLAAGYAALRLRAATDTTGSTSAALLTEVSDCVLITDRSGVPRMAGRRLAELAGLGERTADGAEIASNIQRWESIAEYLSRTEPQSGVRQPLSIVVDAPDGPVAVNGSVTAHVTPEGSVEGWLFIGRPDGQSDDAMVTRVPPGVTPRQVQIAQMASAGAGNREIAARLSITERTVKAHLSSLYRKMGVRNRTELAHRLMGRPGP